MDLQGLSIVYRRRLAGPFMAVAMVAGLSACAPIVKNHGYAPVAEEVADIQIGIDTRGSVRRKIGRPGATGVFSKDGWFYVQSQVEHYLYNAPEVVDRRVVVILFDENDIVASVNQYGLDQGRIIDLETRVTPTHGRELTILQQLLGNISTIPTDVFESQ